MFNVFIVYLSNAYVQGGKDYKDEVEQVFIEQCFPVIENAFASKSGYMQAPRWDMSPIPPMKKLPLGGKNLGLL